MNSLFRHLNANEIEVRVSRVYEGSGAELLLYVTAPACEKILDETASVGPMGWQKHYSRENANCIVSIRNSETGEWIDKEDTGTESFAEKEKGLASDSFKRACRNWGIGRELTDVPRIFVPLEKIAKYKAEKKAVYDSFVVDYVHYNENGSIDALYIRSEDKVSAENRTGTKKDYAFVYDVVPKKEKEQAAKA